VADLMTFLGPRVIAGSRLHWLHFDDCQELCRRHGEDPNEVNWVEPDVVDMPLLRFGIFVRCDGQIVTECGRIMMTEREHPLIGELPNWWPS